MSTFLNRRTLLLGTAVSALAGSSAVGEQTFPAMTVTKDPSCGCCGAWVEHVRSAGLKVDVIESGDVNRVKARLGVPKDLASCHTAEIGGYVVEGHVPAAEIKRLLTERPQAAGLAVAGMPMGSPGMEMDGMAPETYAVILFGPAGRRTFARYEGGRAL